MNFHKISPIIIIALFALSGCGGAPSTNLPTQASTLQPSLSPANSPTVVLTEVTIATATLPEYLSVERIPSLVYPYSGDGGTAILKLINDGFTQSYLLAFEVPAGFAGLTFEFNSGLNVSEYKTIDFVIQFKDDESNEIRLYLGNIAGNKSFESIESNNTKEQAVSLPLSNFLGVNMSALNFISFDCTTEFITGAHDVVVKNIRFSP